MPVSTSTMNDLLPLSVTISVGMRGHENTGAHACVTNSCIVRSTSAAFCAEKFPLRKHGGEERVVDEMLRVGEQAKENAMLNRFHNVRGGPKGHSLSVHPQTLSKSFHFLLGRRVATVARLGSCDRSWRPH